MRMLGLIVGLIGAIAGTGAVAGATYYSWELFNAGSLEKRIGAFRELEKSLDVEVKWERQVGDAFTPEIAFEKVTVVSDDKSIEVERLEIKRLDWKHPARPDYSHLVLRGMKFRGDVFGDLLGAEFGKVLADEQLEQVVVDLSFSHEAGDEEVEDPKTKRKSRQRVVTIKEARVELRGLGTFTVSVDLKDFDVKPKMLARQARDLPPVMRLLGERVQFAGMKLVYQDNGFTKLFLEAKGREVGKGERDARRVIFTDLGKDATATRGALNNNKFDNDYFQPLRRYIGDGEYERRTGLTLTAKPAQNIELRRLFIMWNENRSGFYDRFNPKVELGAVRKAEPKKDPPKKKDEPKKKDPPPR